MAVKTAKVKLRVIEFELEGGNQPEENKNWYVLPIGVVFLGVVSTTLAAAITKLLGLT